jgi:signal transduction histidine kinase
MDKLPLLIQLSAIMTFLALIWLSVHAFRKQAGWGFLVLLLSPVGASIFGIRYWADEKKAFLAYLGSFTLCLSLGIYLFSSWGGWELVHAYYRVQQGMQAQNLNREDATAFIHTSLDFSEKAGLNPEDQQQFNAVRMHLAELEEREQARQIEAAKTGPDVAEEVTEEVTEEKPAEPGGEEPAHVATTGKAGAGKERYRLAYRPIPVSEAQNYIGYTVKVTRKGVQEKEYRLTGATANKLRFAQRINGGSYSFSYHIRDIEKIRVLTQQPY